MNSLQEKRNEIIRELDKNKIDVDMIADDLYALDLTVYSSNYTFDSMLYNSLAVASIDESIALHPEQLKILEEIRMNEALIISAPTSFGKTLCIFEYIAQEKPKNIVLIVPTLALVDEYLKKIIRKYKSEFQEYKIYTSINEDNEYDFDNKNIFLLTHDRVIQDSVFNVLPEIDFLVVDEVYKLETDEDDDRVLVLNMAYHYLAEKSKKYVLLAPFIKDFLDKERLNKKPKFYRSEYSPVVNEIIICPIDDEKKRFAMCKQMVEQIKKEKTLIYFATVSGKYGMNKYIENVIANEDVVNELPDEIIAFIEWARAEIHEEWCVVKALEHGYLIHNGQIPMGIRLFQIEQYENNANFNKLLCTSTLLEGVNTAAKNIIIVQPNRKNANEGECFTAFDFFNLVGRSGRLNEHYLGRAYYIKAPKDVEFDKSDAVKSIRFEIVDRTDDMDIQFDNIEENPLIKDFLKKQGISLKDYQTHIGSKVRFKTAMTLYNQLEGNKNDLLSILRNMENNPIAGRFELVNILYKIINGKQNKLDASIINKLLNKNRYNIRKIVNDIKLHYATADINAIISKTIKFKNSFIEHELYKKTQIIIYYLELWRVEEELIDIIKDKIVEPIEHLYFVNSKIKKTMIDLGIYDRDIDKIVKVIGEDFQDVVELKDKLVSLKGNFKGITFISQYVINRFE